MNERLKIVRKHLKLTQKEFGEAMNMCANYICMLETGKKEISDKFLFILGEVYNVNREWMRTGTGDMFYEVDVDTILNELHIERVTSDNDAYERLMQIVNLYYHMSLEQQNLYMKIAKSLADEDDKK